MPVDKPNQIFFYISLIGLFLKAYLIIQIFSLDENSSWEENLMAVLSE